MMHRTDRPLARGMTVIELLVAIVVVSVLLSTIAQWMVRFHRRMTLQTQRLERFVLATNLLEQLDVLPYDRIRDEALHDESFADLVPPADSPLTATLEVVDLSGSVAGKRLRVAITDRRQHRGEPPLMVTGWRFMAVDAPSVERKER